MTAHVKSFADSFAITDSFSKVISKSLIEAMTISDSIFKALIIAAQIVGLKDIAKTLSNPFDESAEWMPYVAIGTSNQAEDEDNDTALWGEIHRKLGSVWVIRNTYFVKATFGQDEPTGDDLTIYEIGIFDDPVTGVLGRRWVLPTGQSKDNIDEIVIECAVTILRGDTPGSNSSGFAEEVGISDSVSMHLTKEIPGLDDSFNMSDLHLFEVGKNIAETFGIADSKTLLVGKNIADTFTIGGGAAPTYGLGSMVLGVDILGELKLSG